MLDTVALMQEKYIPWQQWQMTLTDLPSDDASRNQEGEFGAGHRSLVHHHLLLPLPMALNFLLEPDVTSHCSLGLARALRAE